MSGQVAVGYIHLEPPYDADLIWHYQTSLEVQPSPCEDLPYYAISQEASPPLLALES